MITEGSRIYQERVQELPNIHFDRHLYQPLLTNQSDKIRSEPHGMLHANAYIHDDKAQLHRKLADLTKEMNNRAGFRNVTLDSYIISVTPFEELRLRYGDGKWDKDRFATEAHVLFRQGQNPAYLRQILQEPALFQSSIGQVVP